MRLEWLEAVLPTAKLSEGAALLPRVGDRVLEPEPTIDEAPSVSIDCSLDIPGRRIFSERRLGLSWFFRYAAELSPRSAVCLNHDGSLPSSACALWFMDRRSESPGGSGVALGERMAFSDATAESGRLRTVGESRDPGRCCHESVPERARPALLGGGFGLTGSAIGVVSLLLGESSTDSRSMLPALAAIARGDSEVCGTEAKEELRGESLVGEIDRARSAWS